MSNARKIHFAGLGDRSINDLAIELKNAGNIITCSFDEITGPEQDKLLRHNILNTKVEAEKIDHTVQAVIVSPHINKDSLEIRRAQELKLPIFSVPEFVYEVSKDKQRVVVTGNHGKALITALIVHVLAFNKRKFDYFTGGRPHGFEGVVKLSDAPVIIIEGQDVSASVWDPTPCFLKYHHHIGVINGIEWQTSSLYPTRDEYVRQFGHFGASTPKGGALIYFELDPVVTALPNMNKPDVVFVPYKTHPSVFEGGQEYLVTPDKTKLPLKISGKHNMQNISAAHETLKRIGVTNEMFYQAVPSFEPTAH